MLWLWDQDISLLAAADLGYAASFCILLHVAQDLRHTMIFCGNEVHDLSALAYSVFLCVPISDIAACCTGSEAYSDVLWRRH